MAISLNGTTGITTPGITNTGAETVVDLTTTGNTILGDASGDTLTVTGGTTTFTQGTANGVAFLNGSKVLTTGSANLTFNGTTLTANTIGAFTLGGTIAGGGNQINNVVIGTTTPLAGSFTTLSATGTLSGGTSGTAYSFSGSAPAGSLTLNSGAALSVSGVSGTGYQGFRLFGTGTAYNYMQIDNTGGTADFGIENSSGGALISGSSAYATVIQSYSNTAIHFGTNNTLRMTLDTSGNVGIGTAPAYKLHVVKGSAGITARFTDGDGITDVYGYGLEITRSIAYIKSSGALHLGSAAGYSAVVLDSAGNLGLGVTPSAWSSASRPALQLTNGAALYSRSAATALSQNLFYNSSDATAYIANGYATLYYQTSGQHQWYTAPSNSSGAGATPITFTQAMTLDASGNLGIGTTSFSARLNINLDNATAYANTAPNITNCTAAFTNASGHTAGGTFVGYQLNISGNSQNRIGYIGAITDSTSNQALSLVFGTNTAGGDRSEKMRLDSSGNLGIGSNNPNGKLTIDAPNTLVAPALSIHNAGNTYGWDFDSETVSVGRLDLYAINNSTRSQVMSWMRTSGYVGIGTSSPSAKLDVNGNVVISPDTAGKNTFQFATNAVDDGRFFIRSNTTTKVDIQANGTSYFEGGTVRFISTISVGNATPSASGAGITFPATQSASSDANTLDDYEEGTWTPIMGSDGGGSFTMTTQFGRYTKIGNIITFIAYIAWSSKTATGNISISGFPFNINNWSVTGGNVATAFHIKSATDAALIDTNLGFDGLSQSANVYVWDFTRTNLIATSSLSSAGFISFSGTYYAV